MGHSSDSAKLSKSFMGIIVFFKGVAERENNRILASIANSGISKAGHLGGAN